MGSAGVQGDLWGRAPEYWADIQEVMFTPLWEAMLDAAGVADGTRLLDAGCGSGGASVLAVGRGAIVSGLDASAPLLDIARRRIPDGDFRVGDLEELPYADGSFDAVIAASSIQYAESPAAAVGEIARVTAVQGRASIGLFSTGDKVEFGVVFAAVRDSLPSPPPGDGPFGLSGPGTLESLVEDAGMTVAVAGEVDCPFFYPNTDIFWNAMGGAGPIQAALGVVEEDTLKAAVLDAVEPFRTADGGLQFENSFRYVATEPLS